MGRPPCCDKSNVKRGLWTPEEDAKILAYVSNHGIGNWTLVPKKAGLNRCGKSCRLRWTNYLRPDLKHDNFTPQEEELIINLHKAIGSRWSLIAKQLPGRTDNDVKNYWNTKLRKKLSKMGIDPVTHKPFSQILSDYGNISGISSNNRNPIGSFNNKTLNNTDLMMISKTEPCSVLKTEHSLGSDIIKNSTAEQAQDLFVLQPNLYNEVGSSACSSSSSTTQLNSPRSFTCKQFQPPITTPPSSPCLWSEFLLSDPVISAEFQQQQKENNISNGKFATGNYQDQFFSKNGFEGFGSCDYGGINGNQTNNYGGDAYSSSASSFVDGILDKDREMGSQFPQLLDPSFDY